MWNLKSCGRSISSFERLFFSSSFSVIGTWSLEERITDACLFNALDVIAENCGSSNYVFVALIGCDTQDMIVEKVEAIQRKLFAIEDMTKT